MFLIVQEQKVSIVLCAGLCPDWETWNPVTPVRNASQAMQLADQWLGIPQVRLHNQSQISPIAL